MITCPECKHQFILRTEVTQARAEAKRAARIARQAEHGKRCSTCRAVKAVGAFGISRARPDGLQPVCGACIKARAQVLALPDGRAIWAATVRAMRTQSRGAAP